MNDNCHFCGKPPKEVKFIIKGPREGICDECVELCNEIIEEEKGKAYIKFLRET